jgi:hypothetical protein
LLSSTSTCSAELPGFFDAVVVAADVLMLLLPPLALREGEGESAPMLSDSLLNRASQATTRRLA